MAKFRELKTMKAFGNRAHWVLLMVMFGALSSPVLADVSSVIKGVYADDLTGDGQADVLLVYEADDLFVPIHGSVIIPIFVERVGQAYLFEASENGFFPAWAVNSDDYDLNALTLISGLDFSDQDADSASDDIYVAAQAGLANNLALLNVDNFGLPGLMVDLNSDGAFDYADSDGDGISDEEELAAGSDPGSAGSYPVVQINSFTATPTNRTSNDQAVYLYWDVQGATSLSLEGLTQDSWATPAGTFSYMPIYPDVSGTYTLVASGPGGTVSRDVSITVSLDAPQQLWLSDAVLDRIDNKFTTSISLDEQGATYVGAADNKFYKISPNGQLEWVLEDIGMVYRKGVALEDAVIIGVDTKHIANASPGAVYKLSTNYNSDGMASGRVEWQFPNELNDAPLDSQIIGCPVMSGDQQTIYLVTLYGQVIALDADTGGLIWSDNPFDANNSNPADGDVGVRVIGDPVYNAENNYLLLNALGGDVVAIDLNEVSSGASALSSEALLWREQL